MARLRLRGYHQNPAPTATALFQGDEGVFPRFDKNLR